MGFRKDAYAKIWKINKPEGKKFAEVELSISKKNKDSGQYETTFSSKFVRFVGTAYGQIDTIKEGDRIKISSCDVESWFNKETGKGGFTFVVFGFEAADGGTSGGNASKGNAAKSVDVACDDDEEEDPF